MENWKKNFSLFWRTGNNYGREAAAFLKRSQLGTAAENNYGQRPPFYYWTAGNYGREAAAILKWYNDNLDYGREAVVFLNKVWTIANYGREAGKQATFELIGATDIIWKWVTIIIGQLRTTTDATGINKEWTIAS